MSKQRLLVISVAVNIVCLSVLIWSLSKMQSLDSRSIQEIRKFPVIDTSVNLSKVPEKAVIEVEPFHWSQIEAQDYQTYIENLRRIGCPEETIRDLVKRDLDQHYDQLKATAFNKGTTRNNYWKTGHPNAISQPNNNTRSELAQLDQEKVKVLKDLFGVEGLAEINRSSPYARAISKAKSGYNTPVTSHSRK